jgi:Zn ribbon nucleic-acid-binding protein
MDVAVGAECPSCHRKIMMAKWRVGEIDVGHNTGIKATVMYCSQCNGILAVFRK